MQFQTHVIFDSETKQIECAALAVNRLSEHADLLAELATNIGVATVDDANRIVNGLTTKGNPVSPKTLARALAILVAAKTACEREVTLDYGDERANAALRSARAEMIEYIDVVLPMLKRARLHVGEHIDMMRNGA